VGLEHRPNHISKSWNGERNCKRHDGTPRSETFNTRLRKQIYPPINMGEWGYGDDSRITSGRLLHWVSVGCRDGPRPGELGWGTDASQLHMQATCSSTMIAQCYVITENISPEWSSILIESGLSVKTWSIKIQSSRRASAQTEQYPWKTLETNRCILPKYVVYSLQVGC